MKYKELARYLNGKNCYFLKEGGEHEIWINHGSGLKSSVPRHKEIKRGTIRGICRDLDISAPF
jgi:mRNA interferase HicA